MTTAERSIRLAHPDKLYINGTWAEPASDARIDVISPHDGKQVVSVAEATEADMDAAVAAAREAFDQGPWPRLSAAQRAGYLRRLSAELDKRMPEVAAAWTEQIGALASFAPFVTGAGKVVFEQFAGLAEGFAWEEPRDLNDGPGSGLVVHEPVGVVAAIAPWNNPFGIMAGKLAPALAAGCTVIMKPAPETPIEAYILAEAVEAVGFPPGVVNLVTADRDASDHLVNHPGVDKVSFTGSVAAGARIGSVCGGRIARCTLELGGKSAAIVLDDFDPKLAAQLLGQSICMSTGQICASLSRVLIAADRHDEFVDELAKVMAGVKVGSPYDPETQMGPLAMARQLDKVEEYIAAGLEEGAKLVVGGKRPEHMSEGCYIEPTLFTDVTPEMRIAREEIFGPVLCVLPFETEEEAIAIANDTDFGLYGAVFSNDKDAVHRLARAMRTGTVVQSRFCFDSAMPFGGFKSSGIGREGGIEGLLGYTETKSVIFA
jgi:acyl-CoA reductase-like NAD-dependent aldehyde dehydrogenase